MHYTRDASIMSQPQRGSVEPKAIYAQILKRMEKPFSENKSN